MKEIIIKVPEDSVAFVEELVERIGGSIAETDSAKKKKPKAVIKEAKYKLSDTFGFWPDINLDPQTYRKKLWGRKVDRL